MVTSSTTAALAASERSTPIHAPSTPTVKPLPARRPSMAVLKRPTTRPRLPAGRQHLDEGLGHGREGDVEDAGGDQEDHRGSVAVDHREERHDRGPEAGGDDGGAGAAAEGGDALHEGGADHRAHGVGGEEDAVPHVGAVGAVVVGELRHLGLEGRAHEERRGAGEQDHADDRRLAARLGQDLARLGQAEAGRVPGHAGVAPVAGVREPEQEDRQGHVEQHVHEDGGARAQ